MLEFVLPVGWLDAAHWATIAEYLQWLPAPYSDRREMLHLWADRAGVTLTRYHFQAIARPGEDATDAGRS